MMLETDIDKICEKIKQKLMQEEIPEKPTGKLIVNLQTGGVSREITLELKL